MRSKFFDLTPEEENEMRRKRLQGRSKLSLAFQLGFYVGKQIVDHFLPTLSVDMIQSRNVISVSSEEEKECKRLNDIWFNKISSLKGTDKENQDATKEEWLASRTYHEMLEEKYLPKTLECHFTLLNVSENDMDAFKKGIGSSLWDSDLSHYSTKEEDISVVADDDGWFTIISLKR
jgi:hypothetical protein